MGALQIAGLVALTCLALGMVIFTLFFARRVGGSPDVELFRRLMRHFYLFVFVFGAIATLGTAEIDPYVAYAALTIAAVAGWERQILLPITAKLRLSAVTGDEKARNRAGNARRMLAIVDAAQAAGAVLATARVFLIL